MRLLNEIDLANYGNRIPLIGGFIENLFPFWWEDYSSVADYLDFYLDGFSRGEIAVMAGEYRSLDIDDAQDGDIISFLHRMNANYRSDHGPSGGRQMLAQIGERVGQLEHGAMLKHVD